MIMDSNFKKMKYSGEWKGGKVAFLGIATSTSPVGVGSVGIIVGFVILLLTDCFWSAFVGAWALDTAREKRHILITKNASQMKPRSEASIQYSLQEEQRTVLFLPVTLSKQCCDVFLAEARLENVSDHAGERGPQMHWEYVTVIVLWVGLCGTVTKKQLLQNLWLQQSWIVVLECRTVRPLSVYSLSTFQLVLKLYKTSTFLS